MHTYLANTLLCSLLFSVAAKLELGKLTGRPTSRGGRPTTFSGLHHPFLVGSPLGGSYVGVEAIWKLVHFSEINSSANRGNWWHSNGFPSEAIEHECTHRTEDLF